mmetsp:Transcript_17837/g.21784  ORF Transcript_17837/g.21784 Transcript_17837/m.21784 type:complete len:120 (+) Transcript_17837:397-756(+)
MFATKGFSYLSNLGKELKKLSQKIAGISRNRFSKGESGKEKGEDVLCKPTGLYTDCKWDEKQVRRMVSIHNKNRQHKIQKEPLKIIVSDSIVYIAYDDMKQANTFLIKPRQLCYYTLKI